MKNNFNKIFITGGAGYIGSSLVPLLLDRGYKITVLDLLIYGDDVLPINPNLKIIKGDIRDKNLLKKTIPGHDVVIHMACISNDSSFDLDKVLSKKINLDAFRPLVEVSKMSSVKRFIYTSTSSVVGPRKENKVTEDFPLKPITGYNTFKADCEKILAEYESENFTTVIIRPATVCGYSPRQRLDVVVNLLTNAAFNKRKVNIFGGDQLRPNIHVRDICDIFIKVTEAPVEKIRGEVFNSGSKNYTVNQITEIIKKVIGNDVEIIRQPNDDNRSYHICSEKINKKLGFVPKYTVEDAVKDLKNAFEKKLFQNPLDNAKYFNVKLMSNLKIQ